MNIKLTDVSFSLNPKNDLCCLDVPGAWYESNVTKVGEGEDAAELLIGEVEVGTVVECPHCGSKFLLNEQGVFEWVNPEEFDLVDAEEPSPAEVVTAVVTAA
jgi:hypothetical protein